MDYMQESIVQRGKEQGIMEDAALLVCIIFFYLYISSVNPC